MVGPTKDERYKLEQLADEGNDDARRLLDEKSTSGWKCIKLLADKGDGPSLAKVERHHAIQRKSDHGWRPTQKAAQDAERERSAQDGD